MQGLPDEGPVLTYRDKLPLRVRRVSAPPDAVSLRQTRSRNDMLLRACIALQDHHEVEDRHEVSAELARLDVKLDLLKSCVHQLVAASNELQGAVPVPLGKGHKLAASPRRTVVAIHG
jgi:hypothetical protein